jgi:hypothetical protein
MPRPRDKRVEAFLLLARSSGRGRWKQSLLGMLIALVLATVVIAGVVWWVWPRPALPELLLAAYDQIGIANGRVSIRGQLQSLAELPAGLDLSGCNLFFQQRATGEFLGKVATDRLGLARVEKAFPATDRAVEFVVRYPGEPNQRRGAQETGRVFVWPADSSLLVVDCDHGISDGDEGRMWSVNNLDILLQPGAPEALQAARSRHRIIYLSASADRPARYNKLRAWLERGWAPSAGRVPQGPLLARAGLPEAGDSGAFPAHFFGQLKQVFTGSAALITGDPRLATEMANNAGVKTFLLATQAPGPHGVKAIKSWKDLAQELSQ